MEPITKFLQSEPLLQYLEIPSASSWTTCNNAIYQHLQGDWPQSLVDDVVFLLSQPNYRVLVYSGKEDFICNYYGGYDWVTRMPWSGQSSFVKQPLNKWIFNNQNVAQSQAYQGLTWLQVENAGHMVPMDQPQVALEMLRRFVTGQPF